MKKKLPEMSSLTVLIILTGPLNGFEEKTKEKLLPIA